MSGEKNLPGKKLTRREFLSARTDVSLFSQQASAHGSLTSKGTRRECIKVNDSGNETAEKVSTAANTLSLTWVAYLTMEVARLIYLARKYTEPTNEKIVSRSSFLKMRGKRHLQIDIEI